MPLPSNVAPLKNSTFPIVPSLSLALATRPTVAGAVKVAPTTGPVIEIVGIALTTMVIDAVVAVAPLSSVAFAVMLL